MDSLFKRGVTYPSDEVGRYVELDGIVVKVDHERVDVDVPGRGFISGYFDPESPRFWSFSFRPRAGHRATVRVYDAGGGFYPDNTITSCRCTACSDLGRTCPSCVVGEVMAT